MVYYLMVSLLFLVNCCICAVVPILSNGVDEVLNVGNNLLGGGGLADAHRTPCQLIESRNFICEEHFVTTPDGYVLAIQHVINPVYTSNKTTIKTIVLTHGLFGSATHWLINSEGGFATDWTGTVVDVNLDIEGRNAPYLLSNKGYDVWIPNLRGCRYSRNHTHLNPNIDDEFWRFSFEQMITYDAPTIIDYVLKQTNNDQLGWIGHSMGTTIIFGLLVEQPEYSKKINPFIALAPVAYVGHITTPIRPIAHIPGLKEALTVGGGEINLPKPLIDLAASEFCTRPLVDQTCASIFYLIGGYDPEQFNITRISVYVDGGFCGTSSWTLNHYAYNYVNDQFARYNFGPIGNLEKYGSIDPPKYNLSAINLGNIVLITSDFDPLSDPTDLMTLKKSLKVPFIEYSVPYPKFSHLDFLWAKNVYSQVYEPMVRFLKQFD
ncbi:gastric triacylglycerol lipase-like [Panonychus citri]|uniref:gastric triacylglycerol lipase-like n=1 Tax=Panonychus citri TaxID=50023 RepID=UPI0023074094|nr:gastric triacylglycerol lipase-like [Panonychus citri]